MSSVDLCRTQISGPKTTKNARTGVDDGESDPLRVLQRHSLGDELADHDVQEGDDQEGEDDREDRRHPRVEELLEHRLAHGTDCQ